MTDLRKAAEMALKYFEDAYEVDVIEFEIKETLRQALAEPANSTTNLVEPKAPSQTEQEPVAWMDKNSGVVGRLHQWENATPLYTAPVDAVNISQERVDETAKRKHEPVDWEAVAADQAMTIAMMRVEKREWAGLMKGVRVEGDKVIITTKNNDMARELCGKLIEEKNT